MHMPLPMAGGRAGADWGSVLSHYLVLCAHAGSLPPMTMQAMCCGAPVSKTNVHTSIRSSFTVLPEWDSCPVFQASVYPRYHSPLLAAKPSWRDKGACAGGCAVIMCERMDVGVATSSFALCCTHKGLLCLVPLNLNIIRGIAFLHRLTCRQQNGRGMMRALASAAYCSHPHRLRRHRPAAAAAAAVTSVTAAAVPRAAASRLGHWERAKDLLPTSGSTALCQQMLA